MKEKNDLQKRNRHLKKLRNRKKKLLLNSDNLSLSSGTSNMVREHTYNVILNP